MNEQINILINELAKKQQEIYFWFRDDDARELTPKLLETLQYFYLRDIPLLLAVIPLGMKSEMVELVKKHVNITVGQHGFSHKNYAPQGEEQSELHYSRSCESMIKEQLKGKHMLMSVFEEQFTEIFVPPYFEICKEVKEVLESYYAGFSEWWTNECTPNGKACLNVQVDFINWKHGEEFAGVEYVEKQLVRELELLCNKPQASATAIGVLLHHELMNDSSFKVLDEICDLANINSNVHIKTPEQIKKFILCDRFVSMR